MRFNLVTSTAVMCLSNSVRSEWNRLCIINDSKKLTSTQKFCLQISNIFEFRGYEEYNIYALAWRCIHRNPGNQGTTFSIVTA